MDYIGYDRIPNPDPLTRFLASLTEVRRALDYRPPEVLDYLQSRVVRLSEAANAEMAARALALE